MFLFNVTQLSDPSDLPKNAYSIFLLLVEHLCVDHIDYALEIGLSGTSNKALIFMMCFYCLLIEHTVTNIKAVDCKRQKNTAAMLSKDVSKWRHLSSGSVHKEKNK